jgi:archaemetzincin
VNPNHTSSLQFALLLFILLLSGCSEKKDDPRTKDFMLVKKLVPYDVAMGAPMPGDWLFEHKEQGQNFEQYRKSAPVSPNATQKHIYLQPIGTFAADEEKIIRYTAEYLEIFFDLKTIVLPILSDSIIPDSARRMHDEGHEQLLTTYILDNVLAKAIPKDAIVIMGITQKDLYPAEAWNFVFGQARLTKRVGVSSFIRFHEGALTSANFNLCLERFIKTSSHEIGHMFSCPHCTHAVCVMNGTNSVYETDGRPNRLCSECLKKLCWNLGFDVRNRTTALQTYFKNHNLTEDYNLTNRDVRVLRD